MWEDEFNKNGGKISIKLKKDFTTIIWEETILALIGNIFPTNLHNEINGLVISIRKDYNVLQIWFKTYNTSITAELERCIKDMLQVPDEVEIESKQFFRSYTISNTKQTTFTKGKFK